MEQKLSIGLDNPTLSGRLRRPDEVLGEPKIFDSTKARFMKKGLGDVWMKQQKPQIAYKTKMVPGERVAGHVEHTAALVARKTFEKNLQPAKSQKLPRFKRRKLSNVALYVLALLLFVSGSIVTYQSWRLTKHFDDTYVAAETNDEVAAVAAPDDEQSEPDYGAYSVDPQMPRLLKIPKFNKTARVMPLGVDGDNRMLAPFNVHDAGWFNGSALPGKKGAAVISGHISGPTEHGVFYDLTKLVKGDEVEIERGDGTILKYRVIGSDTGKVDKIDMTKLMTPQSEKPGLNMITCVGQYNRDVGEYDSRHVVYTEQIN